MVQFLYFSDFFDCKYYLVPRCSFGISLAFPAYLDIKIFDALVKLFHKIFQASIFVLLLNSRFSLIPCYPLYIHFHHQYFYPITVDQYPIGQPTWVNPLLHVQGEVQFGWFYEIVSQSVLSQLFPHTVQHLTII